MSFLSRLYAHLIVAKDEIEIYRKISVADGAAFISLLSQGKYLDGHSGLGLFWATEIESAYVGWADSETAKDEVLLGGYISPEAIDRHGDHPNEVILKKEATIELPSVIYKGKEYELKHQIFKA